MSHKLMWLMPAVAVLAAGLLGCGSGLSGNQQPTGVAADVAAKAASVAAGIGGPNGFGGAMMNGYMSHMDEHMGFHGAEYLAPDNGTMTLMLSNQSAQPCTFDVAFISSPDGEEEQTQEFTLDAGETADFEMPCAEMIGMGSLTAVGQTAVHMGDGTEVGNQFGVPGFLNSDFDCGGTFSCTLMQDTNDLDQDGDTQEFIAVTGAMRSHMQAGGMQWHGGGMGGRGDIGGMFGGMMGLGRP